MTVLIRVELAILVLEALAFAGRYAWRSRWQTNPVGWLVMVWVVLGALDGASLLVLGTRAQPPLWAYAVFFGAQVVFGAWRYILLVIYQR